MTAFLTTNKYCTNKHLSVLLVFALLLFVPTRVGFACWPQKTLSKTSVKVDIPVGSVRPLSKRWLGVDCCPVSPIVLSQLKLGHGLAVLELAENSPAANAGIKPFDILVGLDSHKLKHPEQFSRVIDRCESNEVAIEVIREGRRMRLPIILAERPICERHSIIIVADRSGSFDIDDARLKIADFINDRKPGEPPQSFELIFVRRAIAFRSDKAAAKANVERFSRENHTSTDVSNSWDDTESHALEWLRLQADLSHGLAMAESMEERLEAEQKRFVKLLTETRKQQSNTARLLEFQLDQMKSRYDNEMFTELVKLRSDLEDSLLKWDQMIKRLECYQHSLSHHSCRESSDKK